MLDITEYFFVRYTCKYGELTRSHSTTVKLVNVDKCDVVEAIEELILESTEGVSFSLDIISKL